MNIYRIKNVQTQKMLSIPASTSVNGVNAVIVMQWEDNGGQPNQQWELIQVSNGCYQIKNVQTQKLLDVPGGVNVDGVGIIQYDDDGGSNQQWQLIDVGNGHCKIKNVQTQKLMDTPGGVNVDGVGIIQYDDDGGPNQQWQLIPVGSGPIGHITNKGS